ncbi:Na+-transporting methylmalonyl-CoA/oxaloacetate decarboxylase gamma subunit [Aequitasia blattaphilus]|uniref:DUF5058 family protein n=1 Tax=Aequitasia blattaphilus TaxID=2949332 RepID=A0ABT1E822_9FIRM|nr:DUF5058 family protein [Aequitasia blattaphilus]MCP1101861.1 DUF5058 family protein [Aequitasia blattaphilus]MCR8614501.1 DUF5058 family protein [Aequitasia blattaphilus]
MGEKSVESYRQIANSGLLYLVVGMALLFIVIMSLVFLVRSYRTGMKIGMDKKILNRAILSSATFTVLPSISILLGVIALSGTLGIPFSWLRLSVIGALQYELNVASIAAESIGLSGLRVGEMNGQAFTTIGLVMTFGILGSLICCIFFLGRYLKRFQKPKKNTEKEEGKKPGFGVHATTAMFIGLCSAYIGAYVGDVVRNQNYLPLLTAAVAAVVMAAFEYFTNKKNLKMLDNFSVAGSMLIAMTAAVFLHKMIGG